MLSENIKKYLELKKEIDNKKTDLSNLKDEILKEMGDITEVTTEEGIKATITSKETFSYDDETGIINWLESHGYGSYVVKTINARGMNKELKRNKALSEGLKTMYTRTEVKSLSVSKEEE